MSTGTRRAGLPSYYRHITTWHVDTSVYDASTPAETAPSSPSKSRAGPLDRSFPDVLRSGIARPISMRLCRTSRACRRRRPRQPRPPGKNRSLMCFGAGTGWLIRGSDTFQTGFRPVSDRFIQTGFRPVSDAGFKSVPCRICGVVHVTVSFRLRRNHVIVSCPMRSHVGCTVSPPPCTALTEIQESNRESGPMLVGHQAVR